MVQEIPTTTLKGGLGNDVFVGVGSASTLALTCKPRRGEMMIELRIGGYRNPEGVAELPRCHQYHLLPATGVGKEVRAGRKVTDRNGGSTGASAGLDRLPQ